MYYSHEVAKGGHFAASERPELGCKELHCIQSRSANSITSGFETVDLNESSESSWSDAGPRK